MAVKKAVPKKKIEYEIEDCPKCPWFKNKYCEMKKLDKRPFNQDLLSIFPDNPIYLEGHKEYDQISVKALPIPKIKDKYLSVVANKYSYFEDTMLFPLSGLKLNSKVQKDIHNKFNPKSKVGLMMSAKDIFLHDFIQANDFDDITWAEELKKRNFDFVFSPNTSFYYNMPSCSQIYVRLLQYKSISELLDAGIPTIPSVQFIWESDLKRYAKWLNKSGFEYVYFNMQLATYDSQFKSSLEFIELLNKHVKQEIILLGVFNPERIKELEKIRKFKYVNSHLHVLSTQRVVWVKPNEEVKENVWDAMYYEDTMIKNIKNYKSYMKKFVR